MMSASDRFADWDAAYVLGALPPSERREYEEHLEHCARCRAAIADLAPIPGLLGRLDPADAERLLTAERDDLAERDEHAASVVALTDRVRRDARRRLRRRFVIGVSLAAAAVAVAVAVPASLGLFGARPAPIAMAAVGDASLTADVTLTPVAWGTELSLHCAYPADDPGTWDYGLFVTGDDGSVTELSTWRISAGQDATISAGTSLARGEIASVEIRDLGDGTTMLTASP